MGDRRLGEVGRGKDVRAASLASRVGSGVEPDDEGNDRIAQMFLSAKVRDGHRPSRLPIFTTRYTPIRFTQYQRLFRERFGRLC